MSQRIENDAQVLQYCRAGVSDRFLEQLIGRDRNTLNRVLETCSSRRSEKGPGATTYWIYDLQEVVQEIRTAIFDLHGGSVHVVSTMGIGTTIHLDLPLAEGPAPAAIAKPPAP